MLEAELDQYLKISAKRRLSLEEVYAGLALDELVPPPPVQWDQSTLALCERAYARWVEPGNGGAIPREALPVAPWIFLEYLVKHQEVLLHGASHSDFEVIEPRRASDNLKGGDQVKLHAASSGIHAAFYAIVDRQRLVEVPCIPVMHPVYATWECRGESREGFWFALDHRALPFQPWRAGCVYVLPREPFTDEYRRMQWATPGSVRPLARLEFRPEDFPLLHEVRGLECFEEARRGVEGFPWRGDPRVYPP